MLCIVRLRWPIIARLFSCERWNLFCSEWCEIIRSNARYIGAGLINGSDGKLLPQGNATRAQVAAILMRYIENTVH